MNACTLDPVSSMEELKVNTAKQNKKTTAKGNENSVSSIEYETNPLSVENVENALKYLGRKNVLDKDRVYHYYKFDPNLVTGEMLEVIEKDSTHHILDYPFADAKIYNGDFEGEEEETAEKLEKLKDGSLYIVFKIGGDLEKMISSSSDLKAEKLDELYLPQDDDEELLEYLVNQNSAEQRLPCLLKRPQGRVRYQDQETGLMRPVPNIQVWALVFGIPVATWTDSQGNYAIPFRFSAGTFIGTHAKNSRINVKPLNTVGGFLRVVPQLVSNFIIGSVHNAGWYNACRMRDDINIDFNAHGQPRFWAQILDAVNLHDNYTRQDGISNAPWSLTWYAHWADTRGAGSAPMLSHLHTNRLSLGLNVLSLLFGTNISVVAPNLTNLLTGLLPSITSVESPTMRITNIPPVGLDNHYSEQMMQTSFHELAHASLFVRVGELFWEKVIINVTTAGNGCGGGYGCETHLWAGHTQVNEAWAEYLGKVHHSRIHPGGRTEIARNDWQNYPAALENDATFVNPWIPTGVFYDLNDRFNTAEANDNIQDFTVAQMYIVFNPNTTFICRYEEQFLQRYPNITRNQFDGVLMQNLFNNCIR